MRVGVNLLFIEPGRNRGTESYIRGLLPQLAKLVKLVLFTNGDNHSSFQLPETESYQFPIKATPRVRRILYEQCRLSAAAVQTGCDLLFCPGYLAPLCCGVPYVVAVHDCQFIDIPHAIPKAQAVLYRLMVPTGAKKAAAVITISEFSRNQIVNKLKIPREKVFLTYPGAGAQARFQQENNLADTAVPYFLCVSGGSPHKNLARLLAAYVEFREHFNSHHELVLVGQRAEELKSLKIPTSGIPGVRWLGFVPSAALDELYSRAQAVVVPSLYEGFGLPVVEAMSRGVPVISSNAACLPEVCGQAALLFDPFKPASIAAAMLKVAQDATLRDHLREAGLRNISRFSWESCANQTFKAFQYAQCVAQPSA